MQRENLKSKMLTLLAIVAFFSIVVPANADDFFPLDVWEEMTSWAKNKTAAPRHDGVAPDERILIGANQLKATQASFPFDIWKALNELGGADLSQRNAFGKNHGAGKEDRSNPYWMPEELRTP